MATNNVLDAVLAQYESSKQIKPKKFGRINNVVFTPPRRFENKGITYMTKLFFIYWCFALYKI